MDAKETAQALLAAFEQMTAAIRENTDSLRKLSERQTHMATKIEDWEKALRDDTDATHAVEAAIAKLTEQVKAGAAQAGLNDPRLDAVLEGIKANSARTAALALSGTPVDTGQPIPDPVPADGTQPTA